MTRCYLPATTIIGFDSAWADKEKAPGALCALAFDEAGAPRFHAPISIGFHGAATIITDLCGAARKTLLAIDQPTIVPNSTGMRPCERAVASVASWSGGAIQPANRGKAAMFGDDAPIWRFLNRLAFADDPMQALRAPNGRHVMEVYPALALLDLDTAFVGPRARPRYNPARRKTFRQDHWRAVCDAVAARADALGFDAVVDWCRNLDRDQRPRKSTQDALDSVICIVVAALWLHDPARCAMIGDLKSGYIVAPVGPEVYAKLITAGRKVGVAIVRP